MNTSEEPLSYQRPIEIQGLSFSYEKTGVFDNFSFQSGSRVSVLRGPSGCGKTTLLKLMYGLYSPIGVATWVMPRPAFIVLQSDTLVPWFSGRDNIQKFSPPLWNRIQSGPFYDLLRPFIDKRACEMSYGQRRSVELARAFSADAELLLLDEPFNFLDPDKRRFFLDCLNADNPAASPRRVVLTTHYVEQIPIVGAGSFEFRGDMPHRALVECSTDSE